MASPTSNTSVRSLIRQLKSIVSPDCDILEDPGSAKFQEYSKRWTDIDRKIPGAIVLPRSEEDIRKVVRWAVKASVPFVAKSGGCSEWSTIGDKGLVVDLTHYSAIEVDAKARTATIKGGVTQKEAAVRLAEQVLFTGEDLSCAPRNAYRRAEFFLGQLWAMEMWLGSRDMCLAGVRQSPIPSPVLGRTRSSRLDW